MDLSVDKQKFRAKYSWDEGQFMADRDGSSLPSGLYVHQSLLLVCCWSDLSDSRLSGPRAGPVRPGGQRLGPDWCTSCAFATALQSAKQITSG